MKKILSVLAVLAVASGVVFAADYFGTNGNNFKLQTKIDAKAHVFYLSTEEAGDVLADNAVVKEDVDLTQAGSYEGVSLWLAAGGNQSKDVKYNVTVSNTGFEGANNTHPATVSFTDSSNETTSVTVKAGLTKKAKQKTVKVDWTGNPDLPADTYVNTITVTVTAAV